MNTREAIQQARSIIAPSMRHLTTERQHWFEDADGGTDGDVFCERCAAIVERQRRRTRDEYRELRCSSSCGEDRVLFCGRCGHVLESSLTDHGVDSELDGWESLDDRALRGDVSKAASCYALSLVLDTYDERLDIDRDWVKPSGVMLAAERLLSDQLQLTKTQRYDVPRALRELADSCIRQYRIRKLATRVVAVNHVKRRRAALRRVRAPRKRPRQGEAPPHDHARGNPRA